MIRRSAGGGAWRDRPIDFRNRFVVASFERRLDRPGRRGWTELVATGPAGGLVDWRMKLPPIVVIRHKSLFLPATGEKPA